MLSLQFVGLNVNFAVNLFAAFVCFAVSWLVLDAWIGRRSWHEFLKWAGFMLLTLGFLAAAATLKNAAEVSAWVATVTLVCKLAGLLSIIAGQLMDPLQERPATSTLVTDTPATQPAPVQHQALAQAKPSDKPASTPRRRGRPPKAGKSGSVAAGGLMSGLQWPAAAVMVAGAAAIVSLLYWRRATTGLERHLRPVGTAFGFIAAAEFAEAAPQSIRTVNPLVDQLIGQYGPLWWLAQVLLLVGSMILGVWVWNYLTKRLLSQLFMILIGQAIIICLASTVGFSYLLLRDVRTAQLGDLSTASRVLQYAVSSRQAETVAQAQTAAAAGGVVAGLSGQGRAAIATALSSFYTDRQLSSLVVTDASGVVAWRAQDPDRAGDSISGDSLVRRALVGFPSSNVMVNVGVTAPTVSLTAVSPVYNAQGAIIGTVTVGRAISNAFVDGIQESTGLSSTVYGGNARAATTLGAGTSEGRALGVVVADADVEETVLRKGTTYTGEMTMQNQTYLTAISPLKDVNEQPVGMLQAARPASDLYAAADRSLQLTFLAAAVLILLAAYPLYRLASFVEAQLR